MITRILSSVALLVLFAVSATAQVDSKVASDSLAFAALKADSIPWKYKANVGAGLNMTELNNWAGGGQDAITIRALFIGSLDYAEQRFSWENDLDVGYSLTKQGELQFRKADDRIIFGTKASIKQTDWLRYTGFVDFRTQFYAGYNYDQPIPGQNDEYLKISNFMAPAYLTASLGVEYTPFPEFRLLVAPIASRTIFVLDEDLSNIGAFGVTPGDQSLTDMGAVVNASINWDIVENVTWKARLNTFGRYEAFDLWVVTLENAILMKVNSFIRVGILTDVFYDDRVPVLRDNGTVGPATQLRNQLVIEFQHMFTNH